MISIITPTYNRAQLLQNTVKSIQAQNYTNWELIIMDDGSTDNTEIAIQPFLTDKRIKYFKKPNTGQPDSQNKGVAHATGEFITFLDSDDEAYPNWLEVVSKLLKEDTGIASAAAVKKLPNGTEISELPFDMKVYGKTMKVKFTCGSLFIRRSIFNAIGGYDITLKSTIQTDLGIRLLSYLHNTNFKAEYTLEKLVQINIHSGPRIRTNWSKVCEGGMQFINKHYDFIYENDTKEIGNVYAVIAFSNFKLKKRKQAVQYSLKAIKYNPQKKINYLRLVKYALAPHS